MVVINKIVMNTVVVNILVTNKILMNKVKCAEFGFIVSQPDIIQTEFVTFYSSIAILNFTVTL